MLGAAIEGIQSGDESNLEQLWQASHSRGDQMRKIRERALTGERSLSEDECLDLINLTNFLERTIFMLHEYIGELRARTDQGHALATLA